MPDFIRFDMRAPAFGPASAADIHAASLDMAAWADEQGLDQAVVSEHHGSPDGFLPSPMVAAGAIAGRTERIGISISCLVVPMHDPIRVAEDLVVLDLLSGARVSTILGLGYRPEEFAMFGVDWDTRGQHFEDCVVGMLEAWKGEPFEFQGRPVHVTPRAASGPRPPVFMGGRSKISARRAARLELPYFPDSTDPVLGETYRATCRELGREPGTVITPADPVTFVWVAEDPDAYWERIGPHLLHEAMTYKSWQQEGSDSTVAVDATTVDDLKAGVTFAVLTPDEAAAHVEERGSLMLYPLCGGIPPEVAWESLHLVEKHLR